MPERGAAGRYGGKPVSPSNTALPSYRLTALSWQLIIDSTGRPGVENMAIDQALLDDVERRGHAACLRLYRWTPPCLSFGRNEPALSRYDRDTIARLGVDVVRRPTGGRAVWHDDEVTYAVAAPVDALGCLRDSYRAIHQRLARALRTLGADAVLAASARRPGALTAGACFAQPVGGEVLVRGRKVIGSAQVRQGAAFLQHGSILLGGSQDLVARVSRDRASTANATTLSEALGRRVEFGEVATAIERTWLEGQETWARHARPAFPPSRLPAFSDPAWTWRR
jgi:lipoate-protein ligase A